MIATGTLFGAAQARAAASDSQLSVQLPTKDQISPNFGVLISLSPGDAKPGDTVTLSAKATMPPGWHVAAIGAEGVDAPSLPTLLEFKADGLTALGRAFTPSVKPDGVQVGETTHYQHSGTVTWTREYRVSDDAEGYSGAGSIRFQVCDEEKCLPPKTLEFSLGADGSEQEIAGAPRKTAYKTIGEPIVVALAEAALERSLMNPTSMVTANSEEDMDLYVEQLMRGMSAKEALTLGGTVEVDGESVTLYLPEQDDYSIDNTASSDTRYENTAVFLAIDHNGDKDIVAYESVPSNLPIRIADSMFVVNAISKESRTITLQAVDTPLAGAVLGRKCPEFWYETVDGQVVSNRSILGTVTILDVWAVT